MDDIEWTVVNEGQLLDAMVGHKPVGINKYFQMALICHKFANNLRKDVDPQKIWEHLQTMYNLEALDENESIPFPNHEKEFLLPDSEFGELLKKADEEIAREVVIEPPKGGKEIKKEEVKSPNKAITSAIKDAIPRRDSKEGKDNNKLISAKKEVKKELEKGAKQVAKGRSTTPKEDKKFRGDDTPKPAKRTRGKIMSSDTVHQIFMKTYENTFNEPCPIFDEGLSREEYEEAIELCFACAEPVYPLHWLQQIDEHQIINEEDKKENPDLFCFKCEKT